ncbi:acetylornithine deacetylase [Roseivivax sediminis]|uniref:Acetylornithine deacetylase n=1 Tax=Roseivivax sediminis TaxID=936889 RepID=A0A1I1WRW7_9RHOB|nr:acetylornithine deacetylase [Roseivivax sediminis]SFD97731.1 acetylornithine deacetylase [Roseivivax sediminis]
MPEIDDILARLVAFPTVSRQSNLALLDYVEGLLAPAGARLERFESEDGTRANLWASLGPAGSGGIVLSGHSDVVPVTGQEWRTDPFALHRADGRLYGRGTADMKGFLAVAIHAMLGAAERTLALPLHLAISYDEEIGCLGVRGMLDALGGRPERPALCLIGEPTGMRIATGHKGKRALRACCRGQSGHSALAPEALNALHLGADFITRLRARQERLASSGARDTAYDVPYSTIHVGLMQGGKALNIVPESCAIELEIRHLAADDPDAMIADIAGDAEAVAAPHRNRFPEARIEIEDVSGYPGLDTPKEAGSVGLLTKLLEGDAAPIKVAFGTEGGLFRDALGCPTLVCGPGHMVQGHKPDEFVTEAQLAECDAFLDRIVGLLEEGTEPMLAP